jgi:glycosyltransferase involved in cell wall biosynthesis
MKIAQVAPLCESVPPQLYGGTERVVAFLSDALVGRGHEVTLFASGDSRTRARLVAARPVALRLEGNMLSSTTAHTLLVEKVAQHDGQFDAVHFHIPDVHLPVARRMASPHLTTMHGRLDVPELTTLFAEFEDAPLVSISNAQRRPLRNATWLGTVYHGLPADLLTFRRDRGSYFAFLGRISPEKRVDRAIAIATACRTPLRIAAKVDSVDQAYFDTAITPLLNNPLVEFIGEIGDSDKNDFLGGAAALLFPIDWPEPFGLVMIEALACGVPIVAFRCGSVPEVIDHGVSGYVVDSIDAAIEAAARIDRIDRRACRAVFEKRFTAERMALGYERLYDQLAANAARIAV